MLRDDILRALRTFITNPPPDPSQEQVLLLREYSNLLFKVQELLDKDRDKGMPFSFDFSDEEEITGPT